MIVEEQFLRGSVMSLDNTRQLHITKAAYVCRSNVDNLLGVAEMFRCQTIGLALYRPFSLPA